MSPLYLFSIYNYLCNQCLSPLMLWVPISIRARCTTLCDKVRQSLATGRWFSLGLLFSSTNKTDRHDITEILLKMTLNTIKQTYDLIWTLFLFSEWRSTIWSSRWSDFPSRWWFWFKTWEESKRLLFSFFIYIGGVMCSVVDREPRSGQTKD